ncbi:ABC transporter substrate-binding protein [Paenibacillus contaminans]|uniref:Sugar ABC transporter substrate-binding protein n=1 Tax=Paenibacillus contaminans TaxID=450362 RepID=A0A329M8Y3_9BACL|nr:sugar ABC transporter substrate-binding protein [Paenibacillus contaminans]RAV16404.1 hypothetical protein DQG23_28740 [Paenibacillus contaminans]
MGVRKSSVLSIIFILMLSLVVSACSSNGKPASTATGADGGTQTPATNGEKTKIRFSTWYGPGDIEIWKNVIDRFQTDNPNITVEFEPLEWGAYWQKLQTQLASKSAADVIGMHVGIVYGYVEKNQLAPLDDYLKTYDRKDQLSQSLLAEGQWPKDNPKQFALPWHVTGAALFVNMTAFKEAGIAYPENGWTVDEFKAAAKKLTTDKRFGFSVPSFSMAAGLAGAFGTEPTTADKLHSNYNSPEMLTFKTWLHDLIWKDKAAPNPKDLDKNIDPFVAGKVAMSMGGAWNFPVYRDIKDFEWDIAPMPSKDGKTKTYAGPDMLSITQDSKNKEAAWKFMQFVTYNQKAQELLRATGVPMLKEDLQNAALVNEIAAQKPAHFKVFLEGVTNNGVGYAFTKKFFEISQLELDADVKIMENASADIKKELETLHEQVNKEFAKQ